MKSAACRLMRAGALTLLFVWPLAADPIVQTFGPFTATFYNEGDDNGIWTGDANWTPDQIARVADAIATWDEYILNEPGRQIQMHLFWLDMDPGVLGGSTSARVYGGGTIWQAGEYIWKEGLDIANPNFDTALLYSSDAAGFDWNFSTEAAGAFQIDFQSVVAHEIGHSLGFAHSYDATYDDFGWVGGDYRGLTAWEQRLVDQNGNKPVSGPEHSFNVTNDPVYWDGPLANALYGSPVPVYAPSSWQPGSSLSHVDQTAFSEALMSPSIGLGTTIREPTQVEWAMMQDMGWRVIPEPHSLLLILGAALVLLGRRRYGL